MLKAICSNYLADGVTSASCGNSLIFYRSEGFAAFFLAFESATSPAFKTSSVNTKFGTFIYGDFCDFSDTSIDSFFLKNGEPFNICGGDILADSFLCLFGD